MSDLTYDEFLAEVTDWLTADEKQWLGALCYKGFKQYAKGNIMMPEMYIDDINQYFIRELVKARKSLGRK